MRFGPSARLTLACTALCAGTSAFSAPFTLTIFHNNDGESALLAQDNGGLAEGGIAQFVGTLDNARAADNSANPGTHHQLTLSSGDNFLAGVVESGGFNDDALALIGYDAIAIGNHEFDLGSTHLTNFITDYNGNGGTAPFLSANLDVSGDANLNALVASGDIAASTVVTRGSEQFGIVGAVTENLAFISNPGPGVTVNPVAAAVQAEVDALTAAGVDNVILISHLQGVSEDQALIGQIQDVDIVIAGGGDDLLQNPTKPDGTELLPGASPQGDYPTTVQDAGGNDVVLITTEGGYDYIGQLTVTFDSGAITNVDTADSGPIRVLEGDALVSENAAARTLQDDVEAFTSNPTVAAVSDVTLDATSDHVRSVEANIGNLIADALLDAATGQNAGSEPLIAIQNGGGIRTNTVYPAGTLTEADVQNILPFNNTLAVVEDVTVQQLVDTLENAYSRVVNVNGEPEREGGGTGRFAQIAGFKVVYTLDAQPLVLDTLGNVVTEGQRIKRIVLDDGTVLFDRDLGGIINDILIDIATLSFTAGGGDQYFHSFIQSWTDLGLRDSDVLLDYLQTDLNFQIAASQYAVGGENRITPAVPVPATAGLLLLGIAAMARRRARDQRTSMRA